MAQSPHLTEGLAMVDLPAYLGVPAEEKHVFRENKTFTFLELTESLRIRKNLADWSLGCRAIGSQKSVKICENFFRPTQNVDYLETGLIILDQTWCVLIRGPS